MADKSDAGGLVPSRKAQGVRLSLAERTAILALKENGQSIAKIADALGRSRETVAKVIREDVRDILESNLHDYARLHKRAAEVAAEKGNAEPSQWALERTKVVEKDQQVSNHQGFTVKIGVVLPGLGDGARMGIDAEVKDKSFIDAEIEE